MKRFSLIICTYMRPQPLMTLLQSVLLQSRYPDEILIVDGSTDRSTADAIAKGRFDNLKYFSVPPDWRGLTRQRNYGIARVADQIEIVCFLDDDIVLEPDYFEKLLQTYEIAPEALGVGGYIIEDNGSKYVGQQYQPKLNEYCFDGWCRPDSSRFILRKRLGLDSDCPPGFSPLFSHGRSISFLPPSGKIYPAEQLMGGVSSFRKEVFQQVRFSHYFEGYGLYEDADFCLRVAKIGKLFVNTAARLYHYHDQAGRPNQYRYGKMVVRNGWYVWRTKNPHPSVRVRFKWNLITLVLTLIRFSNIFTTPEKTKAFTEALGRTAAWIGLIFTKPKEQTQ